MPSSSSQPDALHIPYIPQLEDAPDHEAAASILDSLGTRRTIECLNWPDSFPYRPLTAFTIAHTGKNLFIDFLVRCNYLRAEHFADQSAVSTDSCVEFFVCPHPDSPEYWNFELNCIGTLNASHRTRREDPTRLTPAELVRVQRYPSCGKRPFRELEGLFTWSLLIVIPLDLMGVSYTPGTPLPMRANFYKCASGTSQPHYLSWAPIDTPKPDFHRPEFFAPIILD